MILGAAVAVGTVHIGQALALAGLLVAASTLGVVDVAGALLAAVLAEVPEAVHADGAGLASDPVLAVALAGLLVALALDAGVGAVAGRAAVPALKVPVVGGAAVAQFTLDRGAEEGLREAIKRSACFSL